MIDDKRQLSEEIEKLNVRYQKLLVSIADVIRRYYGDEDTYQTAKNDLLELTTMPIRNRRQLTDEQEVRRHKLQVRYTDFCREYDVFNDKLMIVAHKLSFLTRQLQLD